MSALYQLTAAGGSVIRTTDGAHIPTVRGNADYEAYLVWVGMGNTADAPPSPSPTDYAMAYTQRVQRWMDETVQQNGYDNIFTCVSYFNSTKPDFRSDALAALAWRDTAWDTAYELQANPPAPWLVQAPTPDEFLTYLPPPENFGWVNRHR